MTGPRPAPVISTLTIANRFVVEAKGITVGVFTEVDGLSVEIATEDLIEGGQNEYVHKLPLHTKWPNLVFKAGVVDSNTLYEWFESCSGDGLEGANYKLDRRSGSVRLLDSTDKVVRRWTFVDAYPVKWTGPKLAATSSDVAAETLEVCHRGFYPTKT